MIKIQQKDFYYGLFIILINNSSYQISKQLKFFTAETLRGKRRRAENLFASAKLCETFRLCGEKIIDKSGGIY